MISERGQRLAAWKWVPAVLLAASLTACDDDDDDDPDPVDPAVAVTEQGEVRGTVEDAYISYKGIPYAAPPVGELRFMPPEPAAVRDELLEVTEFGGSCVQPDSTFGTADSTEDCLYLNVYRPVEDGSYPVMVWIHGGAFETGSGNTYDPVRLVEQGTVVVTINYRVGILGFLAHPALSAESAAMASGDYGIMDQMAALTWVQDNIANFAGDPDNVTIFGESAGGHSVLTHLVSPASEGLFDKIIVQSGSYQGTQRTLEAAEEQGTAIVAALGCDTAADPLACLRELDAADFKAAQAAGYSFVPNTRPDILPLSIAEALATGDFAQVPAITGTNLDEWRLFVALDTFASGALLEAEDYVAAIQSTLGVPESFALAIAAEYPISDYGTGPDAPSLALGALGTDAIFACPMLGQALNLAAAVPTYAYEFADRDAPNILGASPGFDLGAAHAFEIQYVFNSEERLADIGMTDDQIALANAMVGYWTAFAASGDPNSSDGTGTPWPDVASSAGNYLTLAPAAIEVDGAATFSEAHHCDFWAP